VISDSRRRRSASDYSATVNGGGSEVSCGNGVQEGAHVCSAWLTLTREGLDVLVHPLTHDSVADHTRFALWLGAPLPLRVEV
jgi:hypothetical protein